MLAATVRRHRAWWAGMAVVVVGVLVLAGGRAPDEGTGDDRLYALGTQLKCLQCVGESVAASQAPLAEQFREEIRAQMATGATDDEILAYFADRYGDQVLLDPPATGLAALVWILPVLVVAGAVVGLGLAFGRWRAAGAAAGDGAGPVVADPGEAAPSVPSTSALPSTSAVTSPSAVPSASEAPSTSESPSASGAPTVPAGTHAAGGEGVRAGSPSPGPRWRLPVLMGSVVLFGGLAAWLVVSGSGDRGDGELTGGTQTLGSELSRCQPLAMRDPEAAIECYDAILETSPDNLEALTYRGWARVRAEDAEGGVVDLERVVELDPAYPDARVFLAVVATERGDFATASEELAAFWANDPGQVAVSVVQSEGLDRKVFFGIMSPPTRDCWQRAAQQGEEGTIDQAFLDELGACLDDVLAGDPSDGDARLSRALAHVGPDRSDVDAARTLLDGLLAEDPANADALALLVSLEIAGGNLEEASEALGRLEDLPRGTAAFLIGDAPTLRAALAAAREASLPNPEGG